MSTDPFSLVPQLLATLQESGNIGRDAQANALGVQQAKQALALNALKISASQAQAQQAAQYQNDVQSYYQHPTLENLAGLAAKYPDQADALKKSYDLMNEGQRQSALTQFGSLFNAADSERPDLVAQRLDAIKQAEQGQGIDTSEIDQISGLLKTDPQAALRYVKGFAQIHLAAAGVDKFQLPTDQNHFTSTGDGAIYDQRTGTVVREGREKAQYRTIKNPDGSESIVKLEGGDPASAGAGGAGGSGAPRSVRNNNPGNIKDGKFAQSLPGYAGADANGFAVFANPNAGAVAQQRLLGTYFKQGNNTVASIVQKWAPPSTNGGDNTPEQTANYVNYVAKKLNVDPNDALSPGSIPKIAKAMSEFEGGAQSPSNGGAGGGATAVYSTPPKPDATTPPGDTTKTGDEYLATLPPSVAAQVKAIAEGRAPIPNGYSLRTPQAQQIRAAVYQYDPSVDDTTLKTRLATRKSFTSGKDAEALTGIDTVMGHLATLDHAIDDLHNYSQPLLNHITGAIAYGAGDTRYQTAVKDFNASKNAVARELTRAYRGTGGNVSDIKDFDADLAVTDSPAALHAVVRKYVDLLASRIQSLGDKYNQGMGTARDPITLLRSRSRAAYYKLTGEQPPAEQQRAYAPNNAPQSAPTGFRILRVRPKQ